MIIRKTNQLNEFLSNIQDNFESLNYLIESSSSIKKNEKVLNENEKKESISSNMSVNDVKNEKDKEDPLQSTWILCYQLASWFNQYRSNLDIFNSK